MEEIVISRENLKRRGHLIENSLTGNNTSHRKTGGSDLASAEWEDYSQDVLVRERAYRDFLMELKAQLRQAISDRNADVKLLKELSSKNGVSLAWYLFRIAIPVLDDGLRESSPNL